MYDVRQELRDLVNQAKDLHLSERRITIESVRLVGELERRNAAINLGMDFEKFAEFIKLTPNQYWKRAAAARVIRFFPEALVMLEAGETHVSHLALISPKITQANAEILLAGIKNKSKRDVEGFVSCVTLDGRVIDKEPEVELTVKLTKSQLQILDRAREVLSHGGHVPSLAEIMVKALGDLLEKRDPLLRAERAAARREKADAPSPGKEHPGAALRRVGNDDKVPSPGKEHQTSRPAVPAASRHSVWLRDEGQCTWRHPDGSRCPERLMLELDHIDMWCRGGRHDVDNLRLRCRRHNQFAAEQHLGAGFMEKMRTY